MIDGWSFRIVSPIGSMKNQRIARRGAVFAANHQILGVEMVKMFVVTWSMKETKLDSAWVSRLG